MIALGTKDRLRKASGSWLLFMGAVAIAAAVYGYHRLIEGTGDILFGGIFLSILTILFGLLLFFAGISVLNESLWGLAFALSVILCIGLAGLSPHVIYPVIGYVFLGISVISTVSLFFAKSEFS